MTHIKFFSSVLVGGENVYAIHLKKKNINCLTLKKAFRSSR